ncbi:SPX domain-containing membrane protein At4g22990-like isoform X2 [Benincasa hispida]|uniref:SPX domain-containing membrane protein At4g22990-like isoform X2 n=1 Tax=Benincasa hispida TaxID=102211 RepID=UPI0019007E06|nr:SPX domain-containing membrane protein At4g22990-like isoform X2 [Benincasa hispida]
MVAFGKKLRESQIPEWREHYINYKLMKKKVNRYTQQIEIGTQNDYYVLRDFSRLLDIQEQYRAAGQDLLRLLAFVEINAIGLRKILKKFDKRFGYKFTDYYVKTRANHPHSQLKQVFKQVGIVAVAGAIFRNLAELEDHKGNYISMYDQLDLSYQDPVIDSIKAALNRLSNSTNFLQFLGKHAMLLEDGLSDPAENYVDQRYHFMSLLLNLVNTFLYMVNTYIIVPTADNYTISLGAAATVCGIVIGAMPVAQVFSSVYFSSWSNRSYMQPLVFSSIILVLGNTLYALAYDLKSITILLIGRLFCGLGSARAVNRRYITDCVPLKLRMKASAGFVSASALGMACGPALACIFRRNFKISSITFNEDTLPGWAMALAWLIFLVWLCICFKEPLSFMPSEANRGKTAILILENGCTQPLLLNKDAKQECADQECDDDDDNDGHSKKNRKPVNSIISAYKLLTPSVKVQLFVYFMLKYAMEIVLAESSIITGYYFVWSTTNVAVFLACLGLTVLPVNIIVGSYLSNLFEERQLLLASEIMVCIGIILSFHTLIPYSVPQYVCSALITFLSAEILEGVNLSLLSRVMSSRLSRGTFNGGLLSTEAGTIARVIADGTITLSGYLGESKLLNITLLPSLFICVYAIIATCFTYNSLY